MSENGVIFSISEPDTFSETKRPRKRDAAKKLLRRVIGTPQKQSVEADRLKQSVEADVFIEKEVVVEADGSVEDEVPALGRKGTPAVLVEDEICLIPGEPVVRVEDAPGNARRIFTGIDILASVDQVWDTLTDYEHLADVIPNLVRNEVLELYPKDENTNPGARLRQVGAAKLLPGLSFEAALTLDVEEFYHGMPAQLTEEGEMPLTMAVLPSSQAVRDTYAQVPLQRGIFPRPYAYTQLPKRDISMQSVEGAPGDFSLYQGVWRLQPLTSCAPPGTDAMRLTYAVELSPALPVPVRLLENRIAQDLTENLRAIQLHSERISSLDR